MVTKNKKPTNQQTKTPLISFDQEKMLKVDPHWSQALHTVLKTEKG